MRSLVARRVGARFSLNFGGDRLVANFMRFLHFTENELACYTF